ncbi:MAG: bifunctional heptose 7-phosphate kinase/heptose 1-phosphate adenyltransferase [Planctomycetes bacterium]|nr:bifunctional heptose 7-phosphate kinase/heptose 1-phosphate adenyltransferase [Planctomycetota bacterium]
MFSANFHSRLLVLGDVILDRYIFGNAERVSPEAPVVVLRVDSQEIRLGGAASVAMLLRNLEAEVTLAGVIGDDSDGRTLSSLLRDERIDNRLIWSDPRRPTTSKERVIGRAADRHAHQIVRIDHESTAALDESLESQLADRIAATASQYQAILISDYAKGVCTPLLLRRVIDVANEHGIPVIIDPARIGDYSRYAGATLVKPNRTEAELSTGRSIKSPEDAREAAKTLRDRNRIESVVVTLDKDGMAAASGDGSTAWFPCAAREVYDITGAGDTVLAAMGLCLSARMPLPRTISVANAAAGLQVQKLGVAPIPRDELLREIAMLDAEASRPHCSGTSADSTVELDRLTGRNSTSRICQNLAELRELVAAHRGRGHSVVFTNGCFDLLHVGHVALLQQAAALGDVLIVAVNSDAGVRRLKGPKRPVIGESERAQMIAALGCVSCVVIFDDATPHALLDAVRPDVLVKGGTTPEIVGREIVESYGGRVCRVGEVPGVSTTAVVSRIAASTATTTY